MRLCTRMALDGDQPGDIIDISFVGEDHRFGIIDGELHIEGEIISFDELPE